MGEDDEGKYIGVEACIPGRVRAGVRGASWEIGSWVAPLWRHASRHPVSGKKEKRLARVLPSQTLSQHGTIHGSGRKRRKGIREGRGNGGTAITYPGRPRQIRRCAHHRLHLWRYNGIQVLHAGYANGTWCWFAPS